MSLELMSWAWNADFPSTEKMVLLCLCDHANDDGQCWPSMARIARKCSVTDRTVQRSIKKLKDLGVLSYDDASGKTHRFQIHRRTTPDTVSPRHDVTPKSTPKPPTSTTRTPDTVSPKPSSNLQEPSENGPPGGEPADDRVTIVDVVDGWNDLADRFGLQRIVKLSAQRRRKLNLQCQRFTLAEWLSMFAKVSQSPFLRGKNDRGWRCDFDFVLSENNFLKILEGKYDQQST